MGIDATYKVEFDKFRLFLFTTMTRLHKIRIIAGCYILEENFAFYDFALYNFLKFNFQEPKVVIMDLDHS